LKESDLESFAERGGGNLKSLISRIKNCVKGRFNWGEFARTEKRKEPTCKKSWGRDNLEVVLYVGLGAGGPHTPSSESSTGVGMVIALNGK